MRVAVVAPTVLVLGLALPAIAAAHLGSSKYLRVELVGDRVAVEVAVEAVDASMELDLGEDVDEAAIASRGDRVRAWLRDGIAVSAGGAPCAATAGPLGWQTRDERRFVTVDLEYVCPVGDRALRDDTVFPDDAQHEAFVHVVLGDEGGAQVLRAGRRDLSLGGVPSWADVVGIFAAEGALHFATGYDHVLFLLSLLLGAGFVARRESTRAAGKDVAVLVTAFTLGHSVTLAVAALGLVLLPSRLVETVIAASIVAVAALNVARPEERRAMPWLAVGFGLIHGFGFSSVLAGLLPRHQMIPSLVAFNVGIELAQLGFVALALGPLAWAARRDGYRRWVVQAGSVVIAALAAVWMIERALDL